MTDNETEEISLAELIAALTREAFVSAHDDNEVGRAAANILTDLLHDAKPLSKCWH